MKIKNVRFDLYRAVISLKSSYDRHVLQVHEKLASFDDGTPTEKWTKKKTLAHALWEKHSEELIEAKESADKPWKLEPVIMAAINGTIPNTIMKYGGEKIEIDKNAFFRKDGSQWLISFQISRLRADGLPAKKKIGIPRNDITLDDDEYIGEFTEVLYDQRFDVVIIQANRYGVGVNVVAKYFNYLQKQYDEYFGGGSVSRYTIGELLPIIDENLAAKAFDAEYIRKIHYRCSDENIDAIISPDNQTLGSSVRLLNEQTGVVLDVTLSVKGREPSRTLTTDDIKRAAKDYMDYLKNPEYSDVQKKESKMELVICNDGDTTAEAVDLMLPKVNFIIPVQIEERRPIGSEYLYDITVDEYRKMDSRLISLLPSRNE